MMNYIIVINEKNLEGCGRGLIDVVFRKFPGEACTSHAPPEPKNRI